MDTNPNMILGFGEQNMRQHRHLQVDPPDWGLGADCSENHVSGEDMSAAMYSCHGRCHVFIGHVNCLVYC